MRATKQEQSKAAHHKDRLAYLEEAYRHTLESLEMAASLGVPEGVKPLGTVKQILDETAARLRKLLKFKTLAFFLVREPGGDFYLARCHPPSRAPAMEKQMRLLVENGSAAWALQRKRPVFTSAAVGEEQLLLHSMATAPRIRGIFLGLLGQDIKTITDTSLTLLTIVLRGCASLLEGLELYGLLRQANDDLKSKVRDLEESQRSLKREIERRRKVEEALKHQALHDPLTGLPNRTLIHDRMQQAIRRSQRRAGAYYAVSFMDLDKFKHINDTLGHDAGDKLLVKVGERIVESVRLHDTVARFGGDEFLIFLEEIASPAEAIRVIKRVRQALDAPLDIDGHLVSVTGSFGLVFGPVRQATPDRLLKQANTAMHLAKEAGRNRIKVFSSKMSGMVKSRASLLSDLRRAVDSGRAGVLFTPVHSPGTCSLSGFEAIPAWRSKQKGDLCGEELMLLASREGMAWALWISTLNKALETAAAWRREGACSPDLVMSVRLNLKNPPQSGLSQAVTRALAATGLPGGALRIEVTEDALTAGGDAMAAQLDALRQAGVRLCAGDFGERFFAFHDVHPGLFESLRIDPAKLPRVGPERSVAILDSLVSMARALDMAVLAGGTGKPGPEILAAPGCELPAIPGPARALTVQQARELAQRAHAIQAGQEDRAGQGKA